MDKLLENIFTILMKETNFIDDSLNIECMMMCTQFLCWLVWVNQDLLIEKLIIQENPNLQSENSLNND